MVAATSGTPHKFVVNRAAEAAFEGGGLRDFFVYRDLGDRLQRVWSRMEGPVACFGMDSPDVPPALQRPEPLAHLVESERAVHHGSQRVRLEERVHLLEHAPRAGLDPVDAHVPRDEAVRLDRRAASILETS